MHMLHQILIRHKNNASGRDIESDCREDLIDEIRYTAEDLTSEYQDKVFDWRETETAGRWADEYPINVILSADDSSSFMERMRAIRIYQNQEISHHLERVQEKTTNLAEFVEASKSANDSATWDFLRLAELLYGRYTFDSGYYDTENCTSLVTQRTLDAIQASPNDWAIALFDYHF